jgi:hypothetical protein
MHDVDRRGDDERGYYEAFPGHTRRGLFSHKTKCVDPVFSHQLGTVDD